MNITDAVLSTDQIKSRLLEYVSINPGCTAIELIVNADISGDNFSLDLPALLEKLVEAGELTELEYSLPAMDYRAKSLFYPKGSTLELSKDNEKQKVVYTDVQGHSTRKLFPYGTTIHIHKAA